MLRTFTTVPTSTAVTIEATAAASAVTAKAVAAATVTSEPVTTVAIASEAVAAAAFTIEATAAAAAAGGKVIAGPHLRPELVPVLGNLPAWPAARGLHSSTFRLNVSSFCGMGGAIRGCLGSV